MMNPPFSLKCGSEKEYKFIDHALRAVRRGGTLFSAPPYPAMVKPGRYKTWAKRQPLAEQHALGRRHVP